MADFPPPAGYLPSDRATTKAAREIESILTGRKYVVGVGGVEGGKPKIHWEDEAIIDFLPSERTVAGKGSWADDFARVGAESKSPKSQPAYPMEGSAHIFGDRLQLPQRHGFTPSRGSCVKTGGGRAQKDRERQKGGR